MGYMILPYLRFFDFSGRSSRTEYWMFTLFFAVAILVPLILSGGFDALLFGDATQTVDFEMLGAVGLVIGAFCLLSIIPILALTIRRFHDVGLSGWVYLMLVLVSLVPVLGWLASIAIFVVSVVPSSAGDNQWGENPHGVETDYRAALQNRY